ncbi:hypothetical protein SNEBB_003966 [Seison nebaliae]|nr:hypothetical protein SNEBB_003966 [Seison nebaliae]
MRIPGEIVMEANALLAFELNPLGLYHTYKILGISHGKLFGERSEELIERPIVNHKKDITNRLSYNYVGNQFCIDMTYVDGDEIHELFDYQNDLSRNLKEFYSFSILILRQIQALHFSLNALPIVKMPLFDEGSYANAHNDLHIYNIIITQDKDHFFNGKNNKIPIIIDYAFAPSDLYRKSDDITIGMYNMNLRKEKNIKELNKIHKNRLFNSMQGSDFCTLAVLFVNVFLHTVKESNPESVYYCNRLRQDLLFFELKTVKNST